LRGDFNIEARLDARIKVTNINSCWCIIEIRRRYIKIVEEIINVCMVVVERAIDDVVG
jgi:hypothetical protein